MTAPIRSWVAGIAVAATVGAALASLASPAAPASPRRRPDPVLAAIAAAAARGAIDAGDASSYRSSYDAARNALGALRGVRHHELASVLAIVRGIAARGSLTASRMRFAFLTVERNTQWWSAHGPPAPGSSGEPETRGRRCKPLAHGASARGAAAPRASIARVTFAGSGVEWEYYPGMGLQLQVNGSFGDANAALKQDTPASLGRAAAILAEMLPLASRRAGVTTWEYEFPFDGGLPPWTSGLSQATAVEAYTNAASKLGRPDYLDVARRLAGLFALRAPTGVRLALAGGDSWYLLYDFDSRQRVLNADLDALIALYDLGAATHDGHVTALEHAGLQGLRRRIARFDTGRWSLYAQGGPVADLNYHVLNRDLAGGLCQRTGDASVCRAWRSFSRELDARCPRPGATGQPTQPGAPGAGGTTGPEGAQPSQPSSQSPQLPLLGGALGPS